MLVELDTIKELEEIVRERLDAIHSDTTSITTPTDDSLMVERRAMEFLGKRVPSFKNYQLMRQDKRRMEFLGR